MHYIISYDIVGLVLLALLYILNFSIAKAPSKTAFFYRAIIVCSFIAAFLDVFTIWTNKYTDTTLLLVINNFLAVLHLGFVGSVTMFYYFFVLSFAYEQKKIPKSKVIFAAVVFGYDLITIITSPFTHLIMYYDEAGNYLHGSLFAGTYVVILIFILAAVYELFINYKKITRKQFFIIFSYTLVDIVSAVAQFIHPEMLLIGFSSATSLMVVSFALKSPQELIDYNLGIFNRTAFKDFLYTRSNKGVMAIIHVNNADSIKYLHGLDNGYTIIRKCIDKIIRECKQKLGFFIFTNTFVFICKNEEEAQKKLLFCKNIKLSLCSLIMKMDHYNQFILIHHVISLKILSF